jgi:hypothetical protein
VQNLCHPLDDRDHPQDRGGEEVRRKVVVHDPIDFFIERLTGIS